jgi:hypothetical protein
MAEQFFGRAAKLTWLVEIYREHFLKSYQAPKGSPCGAFVPCHRCYPRFLDLGRGVRF